MALLRFIAGALSAWALVATSACGVRWLAALGKPQLAGAVVLLPLIMLQRLPAQPTRTSTVQGPSGALRGGVELWQFHACVFSDADGATGAPTLGVDLQRVHCWGAQSQSCGGI